MDTKDYHQVYTELTTPIYDGTLVLDVPLEEVVTHFLKTSPKFDLLRPLNITLLECEVVRGSAVR